MKIKHQNLWDAVKAVHKGKCIASVHIVERNKDYKSII